MNTWLDFLDLIGSIDVVLAVAIYLFFDLLWPRERS